MTRALCCLITVAALWIARPATATPETTFQTYLSALKASDWDAAEKCWTPEAIAASKHLGITYTDFLPKCDNASPIVTHLAAIKAGSVSLRIGLPVIDGELSTIDVQMIAGRDTVKTTYYFEMASGRWLITTPLFLFTRNWSEIETRYAVVLFRDSSLINEYALSKLDEWVETIGREIGLTKKKLQLLEEIKIPYYLGDAEDVKMLTGFETYGMTNLQFDAVITQYLPHPHEMVHLLMDYHLESKPLYTMPFLQEGLASHIGGRWGKSPEVIRMMGSYLLRNEVVVLDSVLTWNGFNSSIGMPDLTYPVSAVLVRYLYPIDKLYLQLSSSPTELMAMSIEDIHKKIGGNSYGGWISLKANLEVYVERYSGMGLVPGHHNKFGFPFLLNPDTIEFLNSDTRVKAIFRDEYEWFIGGDVGPHWLTARIEATLPSKDSNVTILLTDTSSTVASQYESHLFAEHFPDLEYAGEMYGIRFSGSDAGVYNYLTNCLEVKYVADFYPSEEYWNEGTKKVVFFVRYHCTEISDEQYFSSPNGIRKPVNSYKVPELKARMVVQHAP